MNYTNIRIKVLRCASMLAIFFAATCLPIVAQTVIFDDTYSSSTAAGSSSVGFSTAADSTGNIYVFGTGGGNLLLKYNALGALVWQKTWSDIAPGLSVDSGWVAVDAQGNVLVSRCVDPHLLLSKFDPAGNVLWDVSTTSNDVSVFTNSGASPCGLVAADSLGNIYVTVGVRTFVSGFGPYGTDLLVKLDGLGNLVWQRPYKLYNVLAQPTGIALDSLGDVYISGLYFLAKFDSNGNLQWDRLPPPGGLPCCYFGLAVGPAGDALVYAQPFDQSITLLLDYDSSGNLVWQRNLDGLPLAQGVAVVAANGLGSFYLIGQVAGSSPFFLLSLTVAAIYSGSIPTAGLMPAMQHLVWRLTITGEFMSLVLRRTLIVASVPPLVLSAFLM